MSRTGNPPIETVGVVDIYAPTSGPYYRLKWPEADGTPGDTSGGRTLDGARLKAVEIDTRVGSPAGPFGVTRLDVLRDQFLAGGQQHVVDLPPWACTICLAVSSRVRMTASHRCAPIGRFRLVRGARSPRMPTVAAGVPRLVADEQELFGNGLLCWTTPSMLAVRTGRNAGTHGPDTRALRSCTGVASGAHSLQRHGRRCAWRASGPAVPGAVDLRPRDEPATGAEGGPIRPPGRACPRSRPCLRRS